MRRLTVAVVTALVVAVALVAPASWAADTGKPAMSTPRFMIIAPHTAEQCLAALDEFAGHAPKLLAKMDFGCKAGDHTGYAIVHAENADAARNMLPETLRASAKVVELNKFTIDQIKSFHAMK
jgi:hypothetical protein